METVDPVLFNEFLYQKFPVVGSTTTSALRREKGEQVIEYLKGTCATQPSNRFRSWVKKREFALLEFPDLGLSDVLCTPSTSKHSSNSKNDSTGESSSSFVDGVLGRWRRVAYVEDFYTILFKTHTEILNHGGYKQLLNLVHRDYSGVPRAAVQHFVNLCTACKNHNRPRTPAKHKAEGPIIRRSKKHKGEGKMIIDCDPGVDDALAIMIALSQTRLVDVLAITCVAGNALMDSVLCNALRVLRACKRNDVPVHRGMDRALLNHKSYLVEDIHGTDGLGDVADDEAAPPPGLDLVQPEHAVSALIRLTREYPGQVTLVALGPLSNLAMAVRLDPGLTDRLKSLVIMGGNADGCGNMDGAEFNFYTDPEAAHIVLSSLTCATRIVPWEACLNNGVSWKWFESWMEKATPKTDFARDVVAKFARRQREVRKRPHFVACDALAMAVALRPDVVTESEVVPVHVELQGRATRGQMVAVRQNIAGLDLGPPVEIVKKCDMDVMADFFSKATA